jgi:hypothetical protein
MSKKIKIFKDSLYKYSLNDKKKYIEILNELDRYMTKITNETIGESAEKALCDLNNLSCNIESHRYQDDIVEKIYDSGIQQLLKNNNILLTKHIGKGNGPIDFEADDKSLSLKTLKRKEGKICPQGGQPTCKSFDEKNNLISNTANKERKEAYIIRWNYLKENIGYYLNKMQDQTFCCDYLLLISNCELNPKAELLKNKHYDFTKMDITYTREKYEERPREGKKPAEFSTTVKGIINGKNVSIGEFQFHKNSRTEVKFRFFNSLFH